MTAELAREFVLLDFDGTLAPIVDDPASAVATNGAREAIARLVKCGVIVGLISGRPIGFLDVACPEAPIRVGLYGLEWHHHGITHRHPDFDRWVSVVSEVAAGAISAGFRIEVKGPSLTAHFREMPRLRGVVEAWGAEQAERTGLIVRPARQSLELHPPIEVDKGSVVRQLVGEMSGSVLFAGDDLGDLPAFDALDELAEEGVDVTRVAVRSSESPEELLVRADVVVDGPGDLVELLAAF